MSFTLHRYDKIFTTLLLHDYHALSSSSAATDNHHSSPSLATIGASFNNNAKHDSTVGGDYNNTLSLSRDTTQLLDESSLQPSSFTSATAANSGRLNGTSILHVYHMVVAVDSVYEFVMRDCEAWRSNLKEWLLG